MSSSSIEDNDLVSSQNLEKNSGPSVLEVANANQDELRKDLADALTKIEGLETEVRNSKSTIEESNNMSSQLRIKLENEMNSHKNDKEIFDKDMRHFTKEMELFKLEKESHHKTKEDLKMFKSNLENEVKELEKEHNEVEKLQLELKNSQKQNQDLNEQLLSMRNDIEKLILKSDEQTSKISDLSLKLENKCEQLSNTEESLSKEIQNRKVAQEAVTAQGFEISELQNELKLTHGQLDDMKQLQHETVENGKAKEKQFEEMINDLNKLLDKREKELEESHQEMASLKSLSRGLKDTRNRQNDEIEKMKTILASNALLLEKRRCEILSLQHNKELEDLEFDTLNEELRKSFGREMELRSSAQFRRTLGFSHATIKAYDTPLPKIPKTLPHASSPNKNIKLKGKQRSTPSSS